MIHKTTFTITVYSRDPYEPGVDLVDVIDDITDGPCIGDIVLTKSCRRRIFGRL